MDISFLLVILQGFLLPLLKAQPGFLNLDCGGTIAYADDIGLRWIPDSNYLFGKRTNTSLTSNNETQYKTVRYFPADDRKYCYNLNVTTGLRYLVRATFLHGNFDRNSVYPKFNLSLGATYWDTITITDVTTPVTTEMVVLAQSPFLSVCLLASSSVRFISTIELRQFIGSMYYSEFERQYLMFMVARINFGALSNASVRYPDDPFDRIWESDSSRSANYQLVDVSPGTQKVATTKPVYVSWDEEPPMKVMQTAVVGNNGTLSYTIYLANNNFQRHASAYLYFAEIEDLNPNETRQFGARFPWGPTHLEVPVNVMENAGGKYRLYEPVFFDISLPLLTPLKFRQTNDSSRGPILNAFEIFKYNLINFGSLDSTAMDSLVSIYPQKEWAQEGGDPCSPIPWTWVQCNSDSQPRIISLKLSGKNLTGNIPQQLTNISGLVEL
ncbi:Leucine-rich repeat protein kinase family protein [Rhynchospora pubera]|uniref:Leucine-rich repeat protein kinase family protein n=1 Tax=Rhynchospora pubera TaxID=906938 RepID=A0AAV8GDL6_9POAL|nr:Leucine-rich repeat protein kinase family protein [Rhynchospora pubera]